MTITLVIDCNESSHVGRNSCNQQRHILLTKCLSSGDNMFLGLGEQKKTAEVILKMCAVM